MGTGSILATLWREKPNPFPRPYGEKAGPWGRWRQSECLRCEREHQRQRLRSHIRPAQKGEDPEYHVQKMCLSHANNARSSCAAFWSSGSDDVTGKVWRSAGVGWAGGLSRCCGAFTCSLKEGNFPGLCLLTGPRCDDCSG